MHITNKNTISFLFTCWCKCFLITGLPSPLLSKLLPPGADFSKTSWLVVTVPKSAPSNRSSDRNTVMDMFTDPDYSLDSSPYVVLTVLPPVNKNPGSIRHIHTYIVIFSFISSAQIPALMITQLTQRGTLEMACMS